MISVVYTGSYYSSQSSQGYKLISSVFIFNLLNAAFFFVLQFLANL